MRGRRYPWGTVNIENKDHCDFLTLRSLVLAHHLQVQHSTRHGSHVCFINHRLHVCVQDLKDVTSQVHYEKYRCEKLTALAAGKEVCQLPSWIGLVNIHLMCRAPP